MAKKRFSPEQVVAKLRQIELLTAGGKSLPQACKEAGITDVTYYRWRKEYGGLKASQAKRMKELERENARLKRVVADSEPAECSKKESTAFRQNGKRVAPN